jgi:hypothetical protein
VLLIFLACFKISTALAFTDVTKQVNIIAAAAVIFCAFVLQVFNLQVLPCES